MKESSGVVEELKRIAAENGGVLQPIAVVESAKPITSPLHSRFEWDNDKASHEYRLFQARQLIRVSVHIIVGASENPERIWISLKSDREEPSGGYRFLTEVLNDNQMRAKLLAEALEELQYFQSKYSHLKELASIFDAMAKVGQKRQRPRPNQPAQLRA